MFRFENISKKFSEQFVLNHFSYEISKGDKIIIVGKSGIGKTTLFRLLLGFEMADSGKIFYNNQLLTDQLVWQLRRDIAYVSQDLNIGNGLVKTFFEDSLSLKANSKFRNDSTSEINQLFEEFYLAPNLLEKNIEELSGGEKQRIAIINALLLKRTIFFLDEITSALDKHLKTKIMDYFFLNSELTILSVSHDNYFPEHVDFKIINLDRL